MRSNLKTKDLIEVPSLNGVCYEKIKEMILSGELSWGEKVDVGYFAKRFGISKFPVIKALDRLALENLVVVSPNRGTYVVVPDQQTLNEVAQIRTMIEVYSLKLSFRSDREELVRALDEVERSNPHDINKPQEINPLEFLKYDRRYHMAIVSCTKNSQLKEMYASVRTQVEFFRVNTFYPDNIVDAMKKHEAILKAIKDGNLDEAVSILVAHIDKVHDESLETMNLSS